MYTLYELNGSIYEEKFSLYGFYEKDRTLKAREELSFFTYFNAFFPKDWVELTNIQNLVLKFSGFGSGKIELLGVKKEDKLYTQTTLLQKDFSQDFELYLEFPSNWKDFDIIYPSILAESKIENFQLAYLTSNSPVNTSFYIGIVICTFNKQNYLMKTLERLSYFQSDALRISVCVVDNAQNLDSKLFEKYSNVTLIYNKNYGGSGGFTRGMLYFSEQEDVTHVLLMDDDIELDERIFQRLEAILKFQKNTNQVISGTMLDALKPTFIYETSAKIAYNKLRYEPYNLLLDASIPKNLIQVSQKEEMEYAAWWFMLYPKELLLKINYSFPFFIRVDDVEYSYRLRKLGYSIHRINGLAIWHEPFYAKDPIWIHYYTIRNLFVHFALYPKRGKFLRFIRLWMTFAHHILSYRYLYLELIINGLKDYLKGPHFLKTLKPDEFHKNLVGLTRNDPDFREEKFDLKEGEFQRTSFFKRRIFSFLCILTGNFFFLPAWKEKVQILRERFLNRLALIFGAKEIEEYSDVRKEKRTFKKNPKRAMKLFLDFISATLKYLFFSGKIEKEWKNSHEELVSKEFWEEYLGIKQEHLEKRFF